jgi:hypothetical protein
MDGGIMSKYDTHFQPVPAADVQGYKTFTYGFRASLKVTGPQALVNRWVKTFMTPRGSDPLDITYGTTFPALFGGNYSYASTDLQDVVVLAMEDASDQVKKQDIEGFYNDDERLLSATLIKYEPAPAGFTVWVEIKNMAGQSLPVKLMDLADRE